MTILSVHINFYRFKSVSFAALDVFVVSVVTEVLIIVVVGLVELFLLPFLLDCATVYRPKLP